MHAFNFPLSSVCTTPPYPHNSVKVDNKSPCSFYYNLTDINEKGEKYIYKHCGDIKLRVYKLKLTIHPDALERLTVEQPPRPRTRPAVSSFIPPPPNTAASQSPLLHQQTFY